MAEDSKNYLNRGRILSALFLRVGSFTFGGGNASIAELHAELVGKRGWLTQSQFQLCYALARLTPGTNLLAFCVATGWKMLGFWGAVVALLSLSIPSSIIVLLMTHLYNTWGSQPLVLPVIRGILAASVGLIIASVWILIRPSLEAKQWPRTCAIVIGAIALAGIFSMPPIRVLAVAAIVGFCWKGEAPA